MQQILAFVIIFFCKTAEAYSSENFGANPPSDL